MSLSALLPAAIPGLAVLSAGVARAASQGLSFAATLADGGGKPVVPPPPASLSQLPQGLRDALDQFAASLRERLAALGTTLSGTVELSADILGDVEVQGNDLDAQTVEQLLEQDQALSAAFHQLAAAFNQALGQTNAATLSMPWDAAGSSRGVRMVVGSESAEMVGES